MFHMRQTEAAACLGISLTAMKNACRRVGVSRWPYSRHRPARVLVRALPSIQADVKASSRVKAEPAETGKVHTESPEDTEEKGTVMPEEDCNSEDEFPYSLFSDDATMNELMSQCSSCMDSSSFESDHHDEKEFGCAGTEEDCRSDIDDAQSRLASLEDVETIAFPDDIVQYLHAQGLETLAGWREAFRDPSEGAREGLKNLAEDEFLMD
eukprot:748811-Hanusia_phi.AAC.3